jgi:DNA polymerase Ligase (LigD)
MPRFVILEHDHPTLHWDLMLECAGALKTWRLPAPPSDNPREAVAIGDHRLVYLDYEGPVSGNRGVVKQWDAGTYEATFETSADWMLELHGTRWQGTIALHVQAAPLWQVYCYPRPLPDRI